MLHSLKTNETILLIFELVKTDEGEKDLMAAISHAQGHLKQQDPLQQNLRCLDQLEVELKTVNSTAEK